MQVLSNDLLGHTYQRLVEVFRTTIFAVIYRGRRGEAVVSEGILLVARITKRSETTRLVERVAATFMAAMMEILEKNDIARIKPIIVLDGFNSKDDN